MFLKSQNIKSLQSPSIYLGVARRSLRCWVETVRYFEDMHIESTGCSWRSDRESVGVLEYNSGLVISRVLGNWTFASCIVGFETSTTDLFEMHRRC
jgi:hypothetical protein